MANQNVEIKRKSQKWFDDTFNPVPDENYIPRAKDYEAYEKEYDHDAIVFKDHYPIPGRRPGEVDGPSNIEMKNGNQTLRESNNRFETRYPTHRKSQDPFISSRRISQNNTNLYTRNSRIDENEELKEYPSENTRSSKGNLYDSYRGENNWRSELDRLSNLSNMKENNIYDLPMRRASRRHNVDIELIHHEGNTLDPENKSLERRNQSRNNNNVFNHTDTNKLEDHPYEIMRKTSIESHSKDRYENIHSKNIRQRTQNSNLDVSEADKQFLKTNQFYTRASPGRNNEYGQHLEPNMMVSKVILLPKIYSDDNDLLNQQKPMAGSENLKYERHYETLPLVAKKSTRPLIQDLQRSMENGFGDNSEDSTARKYNTINDIGDVYYKGFEVPPSKGTPNRRRRNRENNHTASEYMSSERKKDHRAAVENNNKIIQEIMHTDWSKVRERPKQLSLTVNNQDLLKHASLEGNNNKSDRTENKGRERSWSSSSSSGSYCSIPSPRMKRWNLASTPSSISSSPIIWNFSHFYMERKL